MTCSIQKHFYTIADHRIILANNHAPTNMSGSSAVPVLTSLPSLFHIDCEACYDDSYKRSHRATNQPSIHSYNQLNTNPFMIGLNRPPHPHPLSHPHHAHT